MNMPVVEGHAHYERNTMAKYVLDMERFRQVARQGSSRGMCALYNEKIHCL